MSYAEKIAIVVRDDLQPWQKLNVAAFLASAVAIRFPQTHGAGFVNATGSSYLPFIKHPMLVYAADTQEAMQRAFRRAKERELSIGIYTDALFATKDEEQNHQQMALHRDDDPVLAGLVIYGERRKVDKAVDGLSFHR